MVYSIDVKQGASIRRQFQRRAPLNSMRVPGAYRRSPGYADDGEEDESRFFHTTICLIQAGLSGESPELLAKFLKPVVDLHMQVSWGCPTIIQSFGGPDGMVSHSTVLKQRRGIEKQWADSMLELSGIDAGQTTPVQIPMLLCPTAAKQIPRRNRLDKKDLILVLGKKGQIEFTEDLSWEVRKFKKQIVIGEIDGDTIQGHFDAALDYIRE